MKYWLLVLAAGDILLAAFALLTAFLTRFDYLEIEYELASKPFSRLLLIVLVLVLCSYIFEAYNLAKHRDRRDLFANILLAACISFVSLSIVYFIFP